MEKGFLKKEIEKGNIEEIFREDIFNMAEYKVLVTETLQKAIVVEAASEKEASRRAEDAWKNTEYILDTNDFQGVEFYVAGEATSEDKGLTHVEREEF